MAAPKTRVRNNLSLEDKILVLQAFTEDPSFKKLAKIFKCSSKQIKGIVLNKKKFLKQHDLLSTKPKKDVQPLHHRTYELIHKLTFEWYQRAKCYPGFGPITYKMIREKVLDARVALNIATFIPTNAWLVNFRNDCDRHPPDKKFGDKQSLLSLNMKVIAEYVLKQLGITLKQIRLHNGTGTDGKQVLVTLHEPMKTVSSSEKEYSNMDTPMADIVNCYSDKIETSEDGDENVTNKGMSAMDDAKHYGFIKTSHDALKYLKPLEEFVMLEENYRAIGLITQLEAIFLKTSRS